MFYAVIMVRTFDGDLRSSETVGPTATEEEALWLSDAHMYCQEVPLYHSLETLVIDTDTTHTAPEDNQP